VRTAAFFVLMTAAASSLALGPAVVACARQDPPPGTPAQPAPCPDDVRTDLPRDLACCLIQARTSEEAQNCLAKADGGH
jgi:hypothetical protein